MQQPIEIELPEIGPTPDNSLFNKALEELEIMLKTIKNKDVVSQASKVITIVKSLDNDHTRATLIDVLKSMGAILYRDNLETRNNFIDLATKIKTNSLFSKKIFFWNNNPLYEAMTAFDHAIKDISYQIEAFGAHNKRVIKRAIKEMLQESTSKLEGMKLRIPKTDERGTQNIDKEEYEEPEQDSPRGSM